MPLLKLDQIDPRTSVLDAVQIEVLAALIPHMTEARFGAGETIFTAGSPPDAFYIVDEGDVRVEVPLEELDTESVLEYVGPGSFLGDMGVLAGSNREVSAVAHTDVSAHKVSRDGLRRLLDEDPAEGIEVLRALARNTALKLEGAVHMLAEHAAEDAAIPRSTGWWRRRVAAQASSRPGRRSASTRCSRTSPRRSAGRAESSAADRARGDRIGNAADKTLKIQFASMAVYEALAGEVGLGLIAPTTSAGSRRSPAPWAWCSALVPADEPGPDDRQQDADLPQGAQRAHPQLPPDAQQASATRPARLVRGVLEPARRAGGPRAVDRRTDEPAEDRAVHAPRRRRADPRDRWARRWSRRPTAPASRRSASEPGTRRPGSRPMRTSEATAAAGGRQQDVRQRPDLRLRAAPRRRAAASSRARRALAPTGRGGARRRSRPRQFAGRRSRTTVTC